MSYYAFFKRLLLPSILFDCHRIITVFWFNNIQEPYFQIWLVCLLTTNVLARSPYIILGYSYSEFILEIKRLIQFLNQSLYPLQLINNLLPKQFSQRTSYMYVCLAFHSYSQVIPSYCNNYGFGPPYDYSSQFQPAHKQITYFRV